MVVETTEEQYCEKVCECDFVNNCDAPNYRIKYDNNLRALVIYLNVMQFVPFKRIAELISDLAGQKISEGTVQNILRENSSKANAAYEEIRKRQETAPVVGADETGAAVGKLNVSASSNLIITASSTTIGTITIVPYSGGNNHKSTRATDCKQ